MEHVVFFTAADGSPAYRRTANLDDAVRVVEHLRNAEGREEVHVYQLSSVALNFRPYYRVELNANAAIPSQPDAASVAIAPAVTAPVQLPLAQAEPVHPLQPELAAFAVAEPSPEPAPAPALAPMVDSVPEFMEPVAVAAPAPVAQEPAPQPQEPAYVPELAREQPLSAPPAAPAPPQPAAAPAQHAAPAPDPMGQFMPMPPVAQPMPVPEQQPAMAAAAPAGESAPADEADQNGQGRGRSLGFFTR